MKASDFVLGKRIYGLLKGVPGAGKSIAAASMALEGPIYIFDFDGKINAIINYYTNINPQPTIIENITFDTFSDYNTAAEKLSAIIDNPNTYPYIGCIWDSLTTTVHKILAQINAVKGANESKHKIKQVGGIQVTEIDDYMAETASLTRLCQATKFKLARMHFLMTAHIIRTQQNMLDGTVRVDSAIITSGKKVAEMIPPYFDEIWQFDNVTDLSGTRYEIKTQNAGVDFARTSLPLPPKFNITNPILFWPELQRLIKAGSK